MENEIRIYEVGGSIRDAALGLPKSDRDYAVEAASYEAMRDYIKERGKIWQERPEFFTIRAKMPNLGDADFVLCRRDGDYSDGRRPDSVNIGTIDDDLARRDFTMNAIAITPEGTIYDPFGGMKDIENRIIHCVGSNDRYSNTERQFNQDSLRILRAVRLSVTKGMELDSEILSFLWLKSNYTLLKSVSADRIRDEINKMWEFSPSAAFTQMERFDALFAWIFKNTNIWMKATQEER